MDRSSAPAPAALNYNGERIRWDERRLRTERVTWGEITYQPKGICGPRHQRDWQLVVVHSGSCRVTVDDCERNIPLGWGALFRPGHRESFHFDEVQETHHTWCSMRPTALPTDLRRALAAAPMLAPCSDVFKRLRSTAFLLRPPFDDANASLVEHLGVTLFRAYLAMAQRWQSGTMEATPVELAVQYLEQHFGEHDCLANAHAVAGVSRNTLISHFRTRLGMTPARWLWRLRVERGVEMLTETSLNVGDIASRCGFSNPYHFSRLVRQRQSASPKQLRQGV